MLLDLTWPPERWRDEAAKYRRKADATTNPRRREKYMELAGLYFGQALRLEYDYAETGQPPQTSR